MKPEVREVLVRMLGKYERLGFHELHLVSWEEPEIMLPGGRKYYPGVWSESLSAEKKLVVAQLTQWFFLKIYGETSCIGFI